MAQIGGSFTGITTDKARPYIEWSYSQDINGNYSDVTATLYFQKVNSTYWAYNLTGNATGNSNIDGNYSTANITFDLRTISLQAVRSRTLRVNHNADGTKSLYIGYDGVTNTGWGNYNFGAVVALPTIPREAYLTNSPSFTVGNNIPLTLYNAGNLFIRSELYANGVLIKTTNHGQTSSTTITLDSTNNAAIYAQMPSATSVAITVRIKTYSDGGYSNQIGGNRDTGGVASINQAINTPTFTTYAIANLDKNIAVVDKYANTLITSSTQTLTGSASKIIKGYSKVRATILAVNKMVAKNSASPIKYRLIVGAKVQDANYSASDVNIDIDNVDVVDNTITAYDSRNLTTTVGPTSTFSLIANYVPLSIYGLKFVRDNGVDTATKIQFSGLLWNKYFSSNSTTNPGSGVLNAAVFEYRFKETTESWGAQSWTAITPTIDASGNISFDDYVDGDLGATGFDSEKAFDIEVRAYDKLSHMIIESTLSVGTPVVHYTKGGFAMGRRFASADTSKIQLAGSMTLDELAATPSDPSASDQAKVYIKANKLVIAWNDAGTMRYKYLDLTGTGVTWTATTTPP